MIIQNENNYKNCFVIANVFSEVCSPFITSTKVIIGTGFMKCIPMTFEDLFTDFASLVIEIEEVLEAKIAFEGRISSKFLKISFLISKFSVTAYNSTYSFILNNLCFLITSITKSVSNNFFKVFEKVKRFMYSSFSF